MWDDFQFGVKHYSDLERIAIVRDRKWEEWMAKLCKPFTKASVNYFDVSQTDAAWAWLRGALNPPSGCWQSGRRPGTGVGAWGSGGTGARSERRPPSCDYSSIRVPSNFRNALSQAGWAGQAGAVTRLPSVRVIQADIGITTAGRSTSGPQAG